MITASLHVLSDDQRVEDDSMSDWGQLRFCALPREGDRFSIWRHKRLTALEIVRVSQSPVPAPPHPDHEPVWPPDYGPPVVYISARVLTSGQD